MAMKPQIQIKLFAGLQSLGPPEMDRYEIEPGMTVGQLLARLAIPAEKARLIFVDGVKAGLDKTLEGGERVGVFPPVGGG